MDDKLTRYAANQRSQYDATSATLADARAQVAPDYEAVRHIADGNFKPVVFFERMAEHVIGTGELETADYVPWISGRKDARVDGYAGDPRDADGVLTLIICDFQSAAELGRLGSGDTRLRTTVPIVVCRLLG